MYLLPFTLQVREEIQLANLANQYLRDMIKKECWTAMAVKGRSVNAFHLPLSVSNYPMKERTKAEFEEVQYVTNQRKIEEAEADSSKKVASGPTSARNTPLVGKNTSTCATGRKANKRRDRQTNGRTDGRRDRQTDKQTNRQNDGRTAGRINTQTESQTGSVENLQFRAIVLWPRIPNGISTGFWRNYNLIIAIGHSIVYSTNFVFDFSTDERHEFEDEDALADDDGETSGDNPATSGSRGSAYGGGNDLFQSQFQLHTVQQKLNQIVLLQVSMDQKMNSSASLVQKRGRKGGDMMVSRP